MAGATRSVRGDTGSRGSEEGFGALVSTLVDEANAEVNADAGASASASSRDELRDSHDSREASKDRAEENGAAPPLDLLVPIPQPPVAAGSPSSLAALAVGEGPDLGVSGLTEVPGIRAHEGGAVPAADLGEMTATEEPSSAEVPRSLVEGSGKLTHWPRSQGVAASHHPSGSPTVARDDGHAGALVMADSPFRGVAKAQSADHAADGPADGLAGESESSTTAGSQLSAGAGLVSADLAPLASTTSRSADSVSDTLQAGSIGFPPDRGVAANQQLTGTPFDETTPPVGPSAEVAGTMPPPASLHLQTDLAGPSSERAARESGPSVRSAVESQPRRPTASGVAPSTEFVPTLGGVAPITPESLTPAERPDSNHVVSELVAPGLGGGGSVSTLGEVARASDVDDRMSLPTHESPGAVVAGLVQAGAEDTSGSRARKHAHGSNDLFVESGFAASASFGTDVASDVVAVPATTQLEKVEPTVAGPSENQARGEVTFEPLVASAWLSGGALGNEGDRTVSVGSAQRFASLLAHAMPDDAEHVTKQVMRSLYVQWRDGVGEARVQLHPEHLGHVTLSLKVEHGAVTAAVVAETETAQRWIEGHRDALQESLGDQGLKLNRLVVTTSRDGRRDADPEPREQRQRRPTPRRQSTSVFEVRV